MTDLKTYLAGLEYKDVKECCHGSQCLPEALVLQLEEAVLKVGGGGGGSKGLMFWVFGCLWVV